MEHLNGASSSAESMYPQTSEHDCERPSACSSVAPATKTDTARRTPSEIADRPIEKVSKLSVSASSTLGETWKFFKNQLTMSRASQEVKGTSSSARSRGASTELDTGEAYVGCGTREVVLSEAESTTEWYKAIERRDCKKLIEILKSEGGSALLLKTGKAGRTALHVAAIQGSLELVDTIQSVTPGTSDQSAQKLNDAIDVRCTLTASDIAVHIVGYENPDNFKVLGGGRVLEKFPRDSARLLGVWQSDYELTEADINILEETVTYVWNEGSGKGRYEGLIESFEENVDYNFYTSWLFLFHHACSQVGGGEFIEDVIKRCRDERAKELKAHRDSQGECSKDVIERCGDEWVKKLMYLRDLQGRTPRHVAVAVTPVDVRDHVLENISNSLKVENAEDIVVNVGMQYWGVRDGRGWTPIHVAATQPCSHMFWHLILVELGVRGARIGRSSVEDTDHCTASHLAVLHNNPRFFKFLRVKGEQYLLKMLTRKIRFYEKGSKSGSRWCAHSLALLLENEEVVEDYPVVFGSPEKNRRGVTPPICLAAASGNTNILRILMNSPSFDPFERDFEGLTSLHYAANGVIEPSSPSQSHRSQESIVKRVHSKLIKPRKAHTYVCIADVPNVAWLDARYESLPQESKLEKGYSGRKGCVTLLLQGGLDIWRKDNFGKIAEPGVGITDDDFIAWWHEKMAKETLETRNNLNQGGNAISVIGALIATASYVGPLQPPLNYGLDPSILDTTGYAHVWDLPVKIFMMSNSLSFYLAIASIMLAVVPSLPMPQESIWEELERTRKTVASAICVLLLSIVGILVSYAAASIAVMPKHTSFVNVRWTSYPAVVGGSACLIGILLFIIRVLRLLFPDKCRLLGKVWEKAWKGVVWMLMMAVLWPPFMVLVMVAKVCHKVQEPRSRRLLNNLDFNNE